MWARQCAESERPLDDVDGFRPANSIEPYRDLGLLRPHVPVIEGTPIRARTVVPRDARLPRGLLRCPALSPRVPGPRDHHQGIHFHHFWYGLTMMGVAGWLGIVDNDVKFARVYAVVFGVGAGFVGDEVGLLLTFDDYYSELTFEFLVSAVAFLILVALMIRYRKQILEEVFHLSRGERLAHVGVFLIGFSAISFAFGIFELGTPLVGIGIALFALGYTRERRLARRNAS